MPIPEEAARRIRLVVLDVDGVLTDGALYIGATEAGDRVELKRFDVQDGLGIKMMSKAGIEVAIVSGRVSKATDLRARELGLERIYQDAGAQKLPIVAKIMEELGITWAEVALLGDDLADLPVLTRVGLPATVPAGVPEVCRVATWQSTVEGGRGAVREFAEALLHARGEWDALVDQYCRERGA